MFNTDADTFQDYGLNFTRNNTDNFNILEKNANKNLTLKILKNDTYICINLNLLQKYFGLYSLLKVQ
jgi:hypothetical protein